MIIVRLEGGLGNQMFQYALGRKLSLKNKTELKFDISALGPATREFQLNIFNSQFPIASEQDIDNVKNSNLSFVELLKYRIQRKINIPYFRKSDLFETTLFKFDSNILKAGKNAYLTGYWQSHKYFEKIRKTLLKDFQPKEIPTSSIYNYLNTLSSESSVSIHIRRGDYVNNAETNTLHGTCSVEYYNSAIDYISSKIHTPVFYIFSDDMDWVKSNFIIKHKFIYVTETPVGKDYFEMCLMSYCKHNIIANSSFSWWAAWLNQNPDKIVVAPKKWMNTSINTNDLIPANWIRL